eukprot:scaffold267573_cov21-Tisochrysis_lutea.AAC.2
MCCGAKWYTIYGGELVETIQRAYRKRQSFGLGADEDNERTQPFEQTCKHGTPRLRAVDKGTLVCPSLIGSSHAKEAKRVSRASFS